MPLRIALPLCLAAGLGAPARAATLTLEDAVRLSVEKNERARIAESNVAAADARLSRARSFFFPSLAVGGSYTRRAFETVRNVGGTDVTLQSLNALGATGTVAWTLFDARSIPLYRSAGLDLDAARLEATNAKRLLAFEAADAYLRTLGLDQVAQAARRRLELAQKTRADAVARFQAQLARSNTVTRADLELGAAEQEVTRARGALDLAYLELGHLLDTPVEPPLQPPEELLAAPPPAIEPDKLVEEARARRVDLGARTARVEALRALADEPILRATPNLGLIGQLRATNETGLSGRALDGSAGVALTWELYDGGERYAERAERGARAEAAQSELLEATRRVGLEIKSALVALDNGRAAIKQAGVATEVARKNADEVGALEKQNLASALEMADAGVRLFEAEVALARERYGLALAQLDLRAALGLDPLGKEPR